MKVKINNAAHIAEIWLTKTEYDDQSIQESLKTMYEKFNLEKLLPAVYISGDKDLYEQTSALLCYNRRRIAELENKQARA